MRARPATFFAALFLLCSACNKKSNTSAPDQWGEQTLTGQVTSGDGSFDGLAGYQFTTQFTDGTRYRTLTSKGAVESEGRVRYQKLGADTALLTLTPTSGASLGMELEVKLQFVSPKDGTFEGHLKSGGSGSESGLFNLK